MAFLDESALQLVPNKRRVINTKTVSYRETEQRPRRRSQPIFGFMALNGNDVAMLTEECKSRDMISFLELVRSENPIGHIGVILDNARIHIASAVKKRAAELGIILIYLPPYSPDLNPIEFGWKDLKRSLSALLDFDLMVDKSKEQTLELFHERKFGYSKRWREKFAIEQTIQVKG